MTEEWDVAGERAGLDALRRDLGARLVRYRNAAGFTQRAFGEAIGRTHAMVSQVENGKRGMLAERWAVVDGVCGAGGVLVAAHGVLAAAERDHRARVGARRRETLRVAARAEVDAVIAVPVLRAAGPGLAGGGGELVEELMRVVARLVRRVGRRDAMRVAGLALASVGVSGVDVEECARVARALESPRRVDAQVVESLTVTFAHCRRQEDALGPAEVLPTVVAQHGVVESLLKGGCPTGLSRSLLVLESTMASVIGSFLVDLGDRDGAARCFRAARKTGHDAHSPACAAYAASEMSHLAYLSGEVHTAMDAAAAARSLAARTDDRRLKALAEQRAAAAFALDGDHGRCLAAFSRSKESLLAEATGAYPASPAYWVHDGWLISRLSVDLTALQRPRDAVEAASNALACLDRSYVSTHAFALVRLSAALVQAREIREAARVLGDAAGLAGIAPRVTSELRVARAGMVPWQGTPAVRTLDEQLAARGVVLG